MQAVQPINKSYTFNSATPLVITDVQDLKNPAIVISVGSGNTVSVEYSLTPNIQGGNTPTWIAWDKGTITANAGDVYLGTMQALRVTRTAGTSPVTVEINV